MCAHAVRNQSLVFAAPQVVWETVLLCFLFGCMARGGVSHTAIFVVYSELRGHTMQDAMHFSRPHFVIKLCVAILVWAALRRLHSSNIAA